MDVSRLIEEGRKFNGIDKNVVKEDYVTWATKVALYVEENHPQTSVAEKTRLITKQLFMAYKTDSNYTELIGILEGVREYEESN